MLNVERQEPQTSEIWWRRRESNPRPQAVRLRLYMLSRVFSFDRIATRRAGLRNGEPPGFDGIERGDRSREPV